MNETLRDLRLQSKKTCTEVAQALNVTIRTYYRYEQGTRQINIFQIVPLAKLFDVSAEEIIKAQINSCQTDQ